MNERIKELAISWSWKGRKLNPLPVIVLRVVCYLVAKIFLACAVPFVYIAWGKQVATEIWTTLR